MTGHSMESGRTRHGKTDTKILTVSTALPAIIGTTVVIVRSSIADTESTIANTEHGNGGSNAAGGGGGASLRPKGA